MIGKEVNHCTYTNHHQTMLNVQDVDYSIERKYFMNKFQFKYEELDKAFNNILDTFGGADGGVSFVKI